MTVSKATPTSVQLSQVQSQSQGQNQIQSQNPNQSASIKSPSERDSPLLRPEGRVLSTLNPDGSRRWLTPKPSIGRFWRQRRAVAWILIIVFAVLPWIRINGKPAILLDVMTRKFVFFGTTFRPTDTLLLALLLLSIFVGIFLLTALFGRVWCGWACPQTVYMEYLYRPIERLFLGAGYGNSKAKVAPWRRALMYVAFLLASAHLANTFLAYFVGTDRLVDWTFGSPTEHATAFGVFAVTTGLMMFDFCFFREQMCTLVCPYGRFQSVLLDRGSLIVGYDSKRGEPRGRKARANAKAKSASGAATGHEHDGEQKSGCDRDPVTGACGGGCSCGEKRATSLPVLEPAPEVGRVGDCIDCTLCVQTCPTGIDIRDGLQLECLHCAQCIDACDAVMTKIGRAPGLIRYTSQNELEGVAKRRLRIRVVAYPLLLTAIVTAFVVLLWTRADAMVVQLRVQGTPYTVEPDGTIVNVVRVRVDNRTEVPKVYTIEAVDGVVLREPVSVAVDDISSNEATIHVISKPTEFVRGHRDVKVRVRDGAKFDELKDIALIGPFTSLGGTEGAK